MFGEYLINSLAPRCIPVFFLGVLVWDMAQVGRSSSSSRRPNGPRGTGPGPGPARGRHRLGISRLQILLLDRPQEQKRGPENRKEAPKTEKRLQVILVCPPSQIGLPQVLLVPTPKNNRCNKKQKEAPSHTGSDLVIPVFCYIISNIFDGTIGF